MRNFEKKIRFSLCSKRTFNATIALEMIFDDEQLCDDDGINNDNADESISNEGGYDTDLESNDSDITCDTSDDFDSESLR